MRIDIDPVDRFIGTTAGSTAVGRAGDPAKVTRTIAVGMDDTMRYSPSTLTVKKGETVRFLVSNHGKVLHELVLGTSDDLRKHAELMRKTPDMAHYGAGSVHVDPVSKGELVWRFDKPGEFRFACLIPGHYEAGMVGSVVVK